MKKFSLIVYNESYGIELEDLDAAVEKAKEIIEDPGFVADEVSIVEYTKDDETGDWIDNGVCLTVDASGVKNADWDHGKKWYEVHAEDFEGREWLDEIGGSYDRDEAVEMARVLAFTAQCSGAEDLWWSLSVWETENGRKVRCIEEELLDPSELYI